MMQSSPPTLRLILIISVLLSCSLPGVNSFGLPNQCTALSTQGENHQRRTRITRWSVAPKTSSETPRRRNNDNNSNSNNNNNKSNGGNGGGAAAGNGGKHRKPPHSNYQGNKKPHPHNRRKTRSMFQSAKNKEKAGRWKEAAELFRKILDHDPTDAHTHLALARLEAKREQRQVSSYANGKTVKAVARTAFENGVSKCPKSVHIWQAWARYEESCSDVSRARELFTKALEVEERNPYVCHSFGLMEKKLGHPAAAIALWEQGLRKQPTAALVCSLAELLIEQKKLPAARDLYLRYLTQVKTEREMTEIYLASAWLEEKYFRNFERAEELIELALVQSPGSGRAQVALARLEGRRSRRQNKSGKAATRKRLTEAVENIESGHSELPSDGRLFNALAHVEVKSRKFDEARKILEKGIERFPDDVSLLNAAGRVEERIGNLSGARTLYQSSLSRQPSAPTLVALAMLELRHPETKPSNYTAIKTYFERALLLDARHGPAYNAYGNMEFRRGNVTEAREVYKRGVQADCSDPASVYHGLAKIELLLGNVDVAREILIQGLQRVEAQDRTMDSSRHERAVFLVHTLGMLELNSKRIVEASRVFMDGLKKYERCSQLLLGAALCEVKLGNVEKARKLFEGAVLADNKHAQAWQAWGVMESRAGNMTTAKTLFEAGLRSSPRHGALWHAYGVMEGRMGHTDKARLLFSSGVRKCPNHVPLYQGWAGTEMKDGNLKEAKNLISDALTRDKTQGSSWLVAAQIEQLQGNDGLQGLLLRRGIECAPSEASLYRELGEHLVNKGKIDEAREILEKGLEVNPLHAPLYHSLAELEARIFNLKGLANLNERAATIFNANAMVSSPSSTEAWSSKKRMEKSREIPGGVSVLAEKVGHNMEGAEGDAPPLASIPMQTMSEMEDEVVLNELLNDDPAL